MAMRDVKHILAPVDFSEASRAALPAVASLARRSGAVVHLLHVIAPLPWPVHSAMEARSGLGLAEEIRRGCGDRMRKLEAEIGEGVCCEVHVAEGSPAEQVERFVADQPIDLVALPTAGHTGVTRLMLGSTAEKIVRTAACPVLVLRASPRSWDRLATIVVPTDFSRLSKLAIDEAVELARPHGAEILLTHVLEETDYPIGHVLRGRGLLDPREQTRKGVEAHLQRLQAERIGTAVPSTIVVREGVASATIAALAEERGADVVVIASHGREGLARFVLGSTAERVVRIAPCSVLVVKERTEDDVGRG